MGTTAVFIPAFLKLVGKQKPTVHGMSLSTIMNQYADYSNRCMDYAIKIDSIKKYSDEKIRNDIFTLVKLCEVEVNSFETHSQPFYAGVSGYAKIYEFVAGKPMGLDEKWVAAAAYLSSIEILVNKKRQELGISKNNNEEKRLNFYIKFEELVQKIESNGTKLSGVIKHLPKTFWQLRIDVIHYGYVPALDEMELIINWSAKILKALSK